MDPQIWNLIMQLKQGTISQENLVDILSGQNYSNIFESNKENLFQATLNFKQSSSCLENPLNLENLIDSCQKNSNQRSFGVASGNNVLNQIETSEDFFENERFLFPNIDFSAVIPSFIQKNVPQIEMNNPHEYQDEVENDKQTPFLNINTYRYQQAISPINEEHLTKRTYFQNDNEQVSNESQNLQSTLTNQEHDADLIGNPNEISLVRSQSFSSYQKKDNNIGFFIRNQSWQKKRESKLRNILSQKLHKETENCCFAPKINNKSRKLADCCEPSRCRLFDNKPSCDIEVLKQIRQKEIEDDFQKQCTFKPEIHPLPTWINEKKTNQNQKNDETQTQSYIGNQNKFEKIFDNSEKECSFVPSINPRSEQMNIAQAYLQKNVIERLYNKEFEIFLSQKKQRIILDNVEAFTKMITSERNKPPEKGQLDFLERQKIYDQKKIEELEFLEKQYRPSFEPSISTNSRNLAAKDTRNVYERNLSFVEKVEQKKRLSELNDEIFCKFKPNITALGHERPSKSLDDLCYGDSKRKSFRLFDIQCKQEKEFHQKYPFQPKLIYQKNYNVSSRIGLKLTLNDYIKNYNQQLAIRDIIKNDRQRLKLKEEITECSFKPQIQELPEYIQKLNKNTGN